MRPKRTPPATTIGRFEIVQLLYEPADAMMELQIDVFLADSVDERGRRPRLYPSQIAPPSP
jgi:hypothetical protein